MKKIFLFLCCLVFTQLLSAQTVSIEEFEAKLNSLQGVQLLDVRTKEEFNVSHLKGALNNDVNAEDFIKHLNYLDKNKPVLLYCLAGGRSARAYEILKAQGFVTVYDMNGGITAWQKANKPVEAGNLKPAAGISKEDYSKSIQGEKVITVFSAKWCPPCRKLASEIDALIAENPGLKVIRYDVGDNNTMIKELGITTYPTILYYKNGKLVWKNEGFLSKQEIVQKAN